MVKDKKVKRENDFDKGMIIINLVSSVIKDSNERCKYREKQIYKLSLNIFNRQ